MRRFQLLSEGAVVQQAGQDVGLGAPTDREVDLGVLERDRRLGGEQLDELELVLGEDPALADPLQRQDPDRAVAPAERHAHEAPVDRARVRLQDAIVVPLVGHVDRLVVLEDPRREPGLTDVPRLEVVVGVEAASHDRRQRPWCPGRSARSRRCPSR